MEFARSGVGSKTFGSGRPRLSRVDVLARVITRLEVHERVPVRLAELYDAAGVSPRTLRTMFLDVFGITPARYLRMRRLHHLRTALLMADPALRTVSELCDSFRLTDAGRVARDYQRLFGELPSETLARRPSA